MYYNKNIFFVIEVTCMLKNFIRNLIFDLRCVLTLPFFIIAKVSFDRKHRKIAERLGMTFAEYKESLVISK